LKAEAFSLLKYLEPGCWVDSEDTVQSFCLAKVQSIEKDNVLSIGYYGWSIKYDEKKVF